MSHYLLSLLLSHNFTNFTPIVPMMRTRSKDRTSAAQWVSSSGQYDAHHVPERMDTTTHNMDTMHPSGESCGLLSYVLVHVSSQGWASGVLLFCVCCVCDFDVCIWVFVWGGVLETSFLLFLHLFFAGVLCTHVAMYRACKFCIS